MSKCPRSLVMLVCLVALPLLALPTAGQAATVTPAKKGQGELKGVAHRVAALEEAVADLQAVVASLQEAIEDREEEIDELQDAVASLNAKLAFVTVTDTDMFITGANLHILNGLDDTATANGLGNLFIGYNATRGAGLDDRTGSHCLVLGDQQNFSSWGGLLAGFGNTIDGPFGFAAGEFNLVSGAGAAVTGGSDNTASGDDSAVSGGTGITQSNDNGWSAGSTGSLVSGSFVSP